MMTHSPRKCRMPLLLIFVLFLCLFSPPRMDVGAFSVSAPPPPPMSRKARRRAMNSIWHSTQKGPNQNPERALKTLERLLRQQKQYDNNNSTLPILKQGVVWNVLRCCGHHQQQPLSDSCIHRLESCLMLLMQQDNNRLYQVNMTEFAMTTLANNDKPERAQVLLDRHTKALLQKESSWDDSLLVSTKNAIWFHINKNTHAPQQGAEHALQLLERLLQKDTNVEVVSKGMVSNVLRACQQYPISLSVNLLERLIPLLYQRNLLDAKLLNQVLGVMTKCRRDNENAVARAEAIVKSLSIIPTNVYHYCTVLNGHAKRGDAKKAEQLLQNMMTDDRNKSSIAPNTVAYNCVLDALSKTNDETKVAERAELLLQKMQQDERTQPDIVSYTNMLNLYSKHAMGDKALDLLEQVMELEDSKDKLNKQRMRLSELNYRCVIDALAKSGGAERAERLVDTMRTRNVVPNKFHYCGVLNGYAREGRPLDAERLLLEMKKTDNVTPNTVAYNCAMYAWAKSGEVDAPFRARALVDHMLETDGVTPNLITYNCLLSACASRSMAKESEILLKQMEELYESGNLDAAPNLISYNYVLDSLARSGDRVWTVLRAETLVNKMKELYEEGEADTKPNMITYRSLLKCYANWNLPQDADKLLSRMHELHKSGKLEYGPDRVSYRVVIGALSKAEDAEARHRAEELKKEVEERYGKKSWKQETVIDMVDQMDALLEYMRD